jgi:hypothetical protein
MVDIHLWNLDLWYEGDWSNAGGGVGKPLPEKEFSIGSQSLTELRDWLNRQIEMLGKTLESLAAGRRLKEY